MMIAFILFYIAGRYLKPTPNAHGSFVYSHKEEEKTTLTSPMHFFTLSLTRRAQQGIHQPGKWIGHFLRMEFLFEKMGISFHPIKHPSPGGYFFYWYVIRDLSRQFIIISTNAFHEIHWFISEGSTGTHLQLGTDRANYYRRLLVLKYSFLRQYLWTLTFVVPYQLEGLALYRLSLGRH
jgi:hypothetical protein